MHAWRIAVQPLAVAMGSFETTSWLDSQGQKRVMMGTSPIQTLVLTIARKVRVAMVFVERISCRGSLTTKPVMMGTMPMVTPV
tara:strand:- start:216 stop:464 length:249 start_codon:yes stop_codon:yes gene_type:complete